MNIRLTTPEYNNVKTAIQSEDYTKLNTFKERFAYQTQVGGTHPHFWEIMNIARKHLNLPDYHNQSKIERAESWLKSNENHPKYEEALRRYEAMNK